MSRLGFAFIFLQWFKLEHINIQENTIHMWDSLLISYLEMWRVVTSILELLWIYRVLQNILCFKISVRVITNYKRMKLNSLVFRRTRCFDKIRFRTQTHVDTISDFTRFQGLFIKNSLRNHTFWVFVQMHQNFLSYRFRYGW